MWGPRFKLVVTTTSVTAGFVTDMMSLFLVVSPFPLPPTSSLSLPWWDVCGGGWVGGIPAALFHLLWSFPPAGFEHSSNMCTQPNVSLPSPLNLLYFLILKYPLGSVFTFLCRIIKFHIFELIGSVYTCVCPSHYLAIFWLFTHQTPRTLYSLRYIYSGLLLHCWLILGEEVFVFFFSHEEYPDDNFHSYELTSILAWPEASDTISFSRNCLYFWGTVKCGSLVILDHLNAHCVGRMISSYS